MSPAASQELLQAQRIISICIARGAVKSATAGDDIEELAAGGDADSAAARNLDWAAVESRLDGRRLTIMKETAAGYGPGEIGQRLNVTASRVVQLRRGCGKLIAESWGSNGIVDATTPPIWRAGMRATAEGRRCRFERANA